jgi:starch synthase
LDVVAELGPTLAAMDLQLVLLGTGDRSLEETFRSLHARYPDKIGLHIGFDEGLAHRIQAASDLFLVPSRYEPCGLTQLASLRYGTVPIARRTGGLVDTIVPYESDGKGSIQPTGFLFDAATPDALLEAIRNAVAVYGDRRVWARLVRAGMATDVSWTKSAAQYSDLYRRVLTEPRATVPG